VTERYLTYSAQLNNCLRCIDGAHEVLCCVVSQKRRQLQQLVIMMITAVIRRRMTSATGQWRQSVDVRGRSSMKWLFSDEWTEGSSKYSFTRITTSAHEAKRDWLCVVYCTGTVFVCAWSFGAVRSAVAWLLPGRRQCKHHMTFDYFLNCSTARLCFDCSNSDRPHTHTHTHVNRNHIKPLNHERVARLPWVCTVRPVSVDSAWIQSHRQPTIILYL